LLKRKAPVKDRNAIEAATLDAPRSGKSSFVHFWVDSNFDCHSTVPTELDPWIADARDSLFAPFTNGILKDKAAVSATITEPWSNGQVEGQINKLKLVKRQMYGRAKLDLLQARFTSRKPDMNGSKTSPL